MNEIIGAYITFNSSKGKEFALQNFNDKIYKKDVEFYH